MKFDETIDSAVQAIKSSYYFRKHLSIQKKPVREFMLGIYNRLDEIGLIYSHHKNISFNEAIEELCIDKDLQELKEQLNDALHAKSEEVKE